MAERRKKVPSDHKANGERKRRKLSKKELATFEETKGERSNYDNSTRCKSTGKNG